MSEHDWSGLIAFFLLGVQVFFLGWGCGYAAGLKKAEQPKQE